MYEEDSVSEITEVELAAARTDWGNELIAISIAFDTEGIEAATEIANRALDAVYDYGFGPVLFKP
ncbi:MAG: phosphoribosyl-AMP cyclohydrolase, partial [Chloroflexi bacterium]|nr:phosphoribosyl-AMP cyclohydrolase [Chloroflexota bacterium]